MGTNTSKPNNNEAPTVAYAKNELEVPDICNNPDPRSPTPEISRTPLQVRKSNSCYEYS